MNSTPKAESGLAGWAEGIHLNMLVQETQDSFPSKMPLPWAFLKHSDLRSPGGEEIPVSANCFFRGLILKFYYLLFTLHVCTSPTVCAEVSRQLVESIFPAACGSQGMELLYANAVSY